jgi:hypothetical protein
MGSKTTDKTQTDQIAATAKTTTATEIQYAIEELAKQNKIPNWTLKGMMAFYKWGAGLMLTETEFLAKRDAWLKAPMSKE